MVERKHGPARGSRCEAALELMKNQPELKYADIARIIEVSDQAINQWARKYGLYETPFQRQLRAFQLAHPGVSPLGKIPLANDDDDIWEPVELLEEVSPHEAVLACMGASNHGLK